MLPNSIRFYLQEMDMKFIADTLDINDLNPISAKYNKLNKSLCELVENYSMVGFTPLSGYYIN